MTEFAPRYLVSPGDFTTVDFGPTPSQTVGPYLHIGLPWPDGPDVVEPNRPGVVVISMTVFDGDRQPVADALVETWQADSAGSFDFVEASKAVDSSRFRGFGRCPADDTGTVRISTVKPGPLATDDGRTEAPHLNVSVFARGMLNRLVTRLYFPDEPTANAADPVLSELSQAQRTKLIAATTDDGYHLDIIVQDADEWRRDAVFHF